MVGCVKRALVMGRVSPGRGVKGTDVIIAVIKIAYPIKKRIERRILEGKSI